jgi:hypothetical protein
MQEVEKFSSLAFGFTGMHAIASTLPHRDKERSLISRQQLTIQNGKSDR